MAEAYLDLLEAGEIRPTARAIAAQARVSERAVFRHFQDMETLHQEAANLQIERVTRDLPEPAPTTGPALERSTRLSHRWCTIHERVTPVRRAALLQEPFSPEIARRLRWTRKVERLEIEQTFAVELAPVQPEEKKRVVASLCAAMSWETWNQLRHRHDLGMEDAEKTVASMLHSLLPTRPKR